MNDNLFSSLTEEAQSSVSGGRDSLSGFSVTNDGKTTSLVFGNPADGNTLNISGSGSTLSGSLDFLKSLFRP